MSQLERNLNEDFERLGEGAYNTEQFPHEYVEKIVKIKPAKYLVEKDNPSFINAIRNCISFQLGKEKYSEYKKIMQKKRFTLTGLSKLSQKDNKRFASSGAFQKVVNNKTVWTPENIRYLGVLVNSALCLRANGSLNYKILLDNLNFDRDKEVYRTKNSLESALQKYYPQHVKRVSNSVSWDQLVKPYGHDEMKLIEYAYILSKKPIARNEDGSLKRTKLARVLNSLDLDKKGEITGDMTVNVLKRYEVELFEKGSIPELTMNFTGGIRVRNGVLWTPDDVRYLGVLVRSKFCMRGGGSINYKVLEANINFGRKNNLRTIESIRSKVMEIYPQYTKKKSEKIDWDQKISVAGVEPLSLIEYVSVLSKELSYQTPEGQLDRRKLALVVNSVSIYEGNIRGDTIVTRLKRYEKKNNHLL